uniref:Poly [ADP-ribose] polymerase 15-like n=1 Tax=Phallusia mammillata TaxID=59560 RepID=A0A6F9DMI6_9ASCI|nr:poly [ADP-ribose] polymerase 15-like [Phallusia mammillata]
MFLANVITGEYCVGHSDLKVPPEKPGQKSKYDSTVDREHSPRIFVVYKDSSAYASYLITFM